MRRPVLALAPWLLVSACVRVEAGTDPEPLGYGPGPQAQLATGYDRDPAPRPAPTPWTPPPQLAGPMPTSPPVSTDPVPYNDDLVAVCEHLASLAGPIPDVDPEDPGACLAQYRVERVFRPLPDWKRLAGCLAGAVDAQAVAACHQATPRAIAPVPEHPRESAVCMHIFAITIVEQLGPEPMLDGPRLAEFAPLLGECVDSLVVDERANRKPAEYFEMLECIERARTTAAAEACE